MSVEIIYSDKPDTCEDYPGQAFFNDRDRANEQSSAKFLEGFFGGFFGGAVLIMFSVIGIIITIILTCVYNKKCPLYKQRRRRQQPPVVVVTVGEPHEGDTRDNVSLITRNERKGKCKCIHCIHLK